MERLHFAHAIVQMKSNGLMMRRRNDGATMKKKRRALENKMETSERSNVHERMEQCEREREKNQAGDEDE